MIRAPFHTAAPYRPEIDGLRAIAVLAVVLYHFGVAGLHGGFVGVDIFFVISGFLIGGILWKELSETGRISLSHFYMRRIRRLAPAYFAMAGVSLIVASVVLLPFEFREFGKSLIAATVYLSNVHFWREAGYFDSGAEDKMLLHTWSLSVEEQFYIFLPLTLLIFARRQTVLIRVLVGILAASLIASIWGTRVVHTAAFYLFPFRAWEMLTGVLLAVAAYQRKDAWEGRPGLSWLGLGLVLVSILTAKAGPTFPGWQALLPVAGTALIILNGHHANAVNRALSRPAPVFVGLLSYSLYIWHWPILTLSTYWRGTYAGPGEAAFWLALTGVVSYLSWRFIETPFRRPRRARSWPMLTGLATGSALLLVAGGAIYLRDGMTGRFPPHVRTHIEASADFLQDWSRCTVPDAGPLAGIETCPIGPEGTPRVLIWGDSHVRAFKEGLDLLAHETDTPALILWRAGCPPLFDLAKTENTATRSQDAACLAANETIRAAIPGMAADTVLLIGRWAYYAQGTGIGRDEENRITLHAAPGGSLPQDAGQGALFAGALSLTAKALDSFGKRVFVLRQMPEIPRYDSRQVAREMAHGRLRDGPELARILHADGTDLNARGDLADSELWRLHKSGTARVIDPWPELCAPQGCSAVDAEGRALYFDNNHITNHAARKLRHIFAPVMSGDAGPRKLARDG